jgi:hypothetical protein
MGGIFKESIALTEIDGRRCLGLTGHVRPENTGGFTRMALNSPPEVRALYALDYHRVLLVFDLQTPDCVRPWQSYRIGRRVVGAGPNGRKSSCGSSLAG